MEALGRIHVLEESDWRNPLRDLPGKARPYLAGEVWSRVPGSVDDQDSRRVLRLFYCNDRLPGGDDASSLRAYLRSPNEELFVVWGAVGVGKSWFLRYELSESDYSTATGDICADVIDLLHGWPGSAAETALTHLCPIIDNYFTFNNVNTQTVLRTYRESQLSRRGIEATNLDLDADTELKTWLDRDDGPDRAELLLRVLETVDGPPLFLVIDNIDKTSDADQNALVGMAAQLFRSPRIKIIVPLRKTSLLLRDRFAKLHEQPFRHLTLAPLKMMPMLQIRFQYSRQGTRLAEMPPIREGRHEFSFPDICKLITGSDVGDMICEIAGSDARIALMLVSQLLESNHLRGLSHLSNPQYALASWMLSDIGAVEPVSPVLLNLFDSEEPEGTPGYPFIRYRVLEYFTSRNDVSPNTKPFRRYFDRLGYAVPRIRAVLLTFLRSGLLLSTEGASPDEIEADPDKPIGPLRITETGRAYWTRLLSMEWYYVTVKRASRVPQRIIQTDTEKGTQFITHTDFVRWLKKEEEEERQRVKRWESSRQHMKIDLRQPHTDAERLLRHLEQD